MLGWGGICRSAMSGVALIGASRIIAIDTISAILEKAREMGATGTINVSNVYSVEAVEEFTGGAGVPYSFEAWPEEERQAMLCCVRMVARPLSR
jgi:Zn-dependent alcohol dehydrogenase